MVAIQPFIRCLPDEPYSPRLFVEHSRSAGYLRPFQYALDAPVCKAGTRRAYIDSTQRLFACFESSVPIADLKLERFSDVWLDDSRWGQWRTTTLADMPSCMTCDVRSGCHICPAALFDNRGRMCEERTRLVASAWADNIQR